MTSLAAFLVSIGGIAVAWAMYSAKRVPVLNVPSLQTLFEHKFYFDELYDALFYRPAVALARGFAWLIEVPLVLGSVGEIGATFRRLGGETSRVQTGLVRTYALAIAAGVAVMAIVFVAVR